ncbi:MAG: SPASM domain-containing protein [Deltaproteobacteria bacterium]|nr:SPASM domain-containing protein [Deltaproteobacteria bacterium]
MPVKRDDPNPWVFGNVREHDPMEIRENETFRNFRENLARETPALPCHTCQKRMMG